MSTLTLELPAELARRLDLSAPAAALTPVAWLPVALEALQAFRDHH